jgi:ribosomal protein S18 acetylase RimI-like enzyme
MVELRQVPVEDFGPVYRMLCERTGERDREAVESWYDEYPELFWGAYDQGALVGFALGRPRTGSSVELVGIAVDDEYTRRGIGSRLLGDFEGAVADLGYDRVSLGSAGGYVDEFYVSNGYYPESILVRSARDELPEDYLERFAVLRERGDDGTWKVYLAPKGCDQERVELVREAFGDPEAIYIMEKYL